MSSFDDWIGRTRSATDTITDRLAREFRVTIGGMHCNGPDAPGLQWILAPDIYPAEDLGRDAHPRLGLVVPDLGLPRRMWAGGSITWHGGIREGDTVTRDTTVRDITFKDGRTGRLGFVTLDHRYLVGGALRVEEVHDIVYREDPDPSAPTPVPPKAEPWEGAEVRRATPDATLLFRYSAMTFNGHRIHYDHDYATQVEGYAGLVVHGPIQSTWMQHLATDMLGQVPGAFRYRGLSPLTVGTPVAVEARRTDTGLDLRVRDLTRDVVTMAATAQA
ncbi:FAS1-like dehydratase domain-containing protein [Pseudooceanicola onchidii]|uniref:FAS1-like dehydratase domain-containing protein n=1 Tax=Pseudooceanicola onchidii TaxID=2562279 RepID=UPI0010A9C956|nr:MaoC family dehydratase N-terminal domain-containing protein [Pseudooceanicola onchidii]